MRSTGRALPPRQGRRQIQRGPHPFLIFVATILACLAIVLLYILVAHLVRTRKNMRLNTLFIQWAAPPTELPTTLATNGGAPVRIKSDGVHGNVWYGSATLSTSTIRDLTEGKPLSAVLGGRRFNCSKALQLSPHSIKTRCAGPMCWWFLQLSGSNSPSTQVSLQPSQPMVTVKLGTPPSPLASAAVGSIPRRLFQIWYQGSTVPVRMKNTMDRWLENNPGLTRFMYDGASAREMIKNFFPPCVLKAFDTIVPIALKCDLWRYCVLYLYGGFYVDVKAMISPGFCLLDTLPSDTDFFGVVDLPVFPTYWDEGLYNAIMGVSPRNPIMKAAIDRVVHNVETRNVGKTKLDFSGPRLLGFSVADVFRIPNHFRSGTMVHKDTEGVSRKLVLFQSHLGIWSLSRGFKITTPEGGDAFQTEYPNYRDDQVQHSSQPYYVELWKKKAIFAES